MFDVLLESGRHPTVGRLAPGASIALLVHVTLGTAAVWATLQPKSTAQAAPARVVIPWPADQERTAPPGPPDLTWGDGLNTPPVAPPIDVLPVDAGSPDARQWLRAPIDAAGSSPLNSDPGALWSVDRVEDAPVLLSAAPPAYPESLRRAGMEGRVVVEAVIDSTGRAERGSVRVIESTQAGFDQAAREYILRALFRPARVHGRAVRVLVRIPIDFTLRPGR